jgi:hypothetical protein
MKVVQSHHQVLSIWAEYRRERERAPILITLDHHTDTSLPFRNYLREKFPDNKRQQDDERQKLLHQISYSDVASVKAAQALLSHDEHIITALGSDILSACFVIAQNAMDTELQVYREHKVCCYSVARTGVQATMGECDRVLEADFLRSALQHFNKVRLQNDESELLTQDYILDVDLDYFNTHRGTTPKDPTVYQQLVKNAGLITVAAEPEHVLLCAREAGVNSALLLESLKKLHAPTH